MEEKIPIVYGFEASNLVQQQQKRPKKCIITGAISLCTFAIALVCVIMITKKTKQRECGSALYVSELLKEWPTPYCWGIYKYNYGRDLMTEKNEVLKVEYPAGSWSPSTDPKGGMSIYVSPRSFFPTDKVNLSFQLAFDETFSWIKGGKILGLWIGDIGASGGNHIEDGASIRISWISQGKAIAYLYVPENQYQGFKNIPGYVDNHPFGISIWKEEFQLQPHMTWNNITVAVKLNEKDYDGFLELTINNVTRNYDKMNWRNDKNLKINGIMMNTFFGGNDVSWATPRTTWTYYKSFAIY